MTKRLPPMIDDPSQPQSVRELLEAGRDFKVTDYDFDKGLTDHLGQIQAGAPTPPWAETLTPAGAAAGATAGTSIATWIVLPVLTAVVIAAVVLNTSPDREAPRPATSALPAPAPAAVEPAPAGEPPAAVASGAAQAPSLAPAQAAPRAQPLPVAPRAHAAAKPARADKRAQAEGGARAAKATSPQVAVARPSAQPQSRAGQPATGRGQDSAPVAEARPSAAAEPAPTIEIEDPAPAEAAAEAAPSDRPAPAPQDDARLEREMAMLAMSQRVLHADPARALKLARQGEAEFAGSMFTQERQQLLLLSLVKLGQLEEAKRLAKPYLARYPKGPFSDRVRRALATGRVEH